VAEAQSLVGTVESPVTIRIFVEILARKFNEHFRKCYSGVQPTVAAVLHQRFKTEWNLHGKNVPDMVVAIRTDNVKQADKTGRLAWYAAAAGLVDGVSTARGH
jgi:hypothetical protein